MLVFLEVCNFVRQLDMFFFFFTGSETENCGRIFLVPGMFLYVSVPYKRLNGTQVRKKKIKTFVFSANFLLFCALFETLSNVLISFTMLL